MAAALSGMVWRLRQFMAAAGLPAWAAAVLLAATGVMALAVVWPAALETQRLVVGNAELAEQRRQARARAEAEPAAPQAAAAGSLALFERRFDGPAAITRTVARLERSALRHGVLLQGASFRLEAPAGQPLARYTIDWPLKADYPALRRHIAQALREEPALALVAVQVQREDPAQSRLSARLRWVLFVAGEGRAP